MLHVSYPTTDHVCMRRLCSHRVQRVLFIYQVEWEMSVVSWRHAAQRAAQWCAREWMHDLSHPSHLLFMRAVPLEQMFAATLHSFECPHGCHTYLSYNDLQAHEKTCGTKLIKCPICDLRYERANLWKHFWTDHNLRKYMCDCHGIEYMSKACLDMRDFSFEVPRDDSILRSPHSLEEFLEWLPSLSPEQKGRYLLLGDESRPVLLFVEWHITIVHRMMTTTVLRVHVCVAVSWTTCFACEQLTRVRV